MKKINFVLITAVYIAAFAYSGCKKGIQPVEQNGQTIEAQTQASGAQTAETKNGQSYTKKETYFRLPESNGKIIDLADYAGKPVMVLFFTETCPYCRKAAPFIGQMAEKYADKLTTIGIALEDEPAAAVGFARDFKFSFPIAYNGSEVAAAYHTQGVPYIYILDKNHNQAKMWAGYDQSFNGEIEQSIKTVIN